MTDPMTPERLAEIEQRFASGRVVNVVTQRDLLAEVRRLQAAVANWQTWSDNLTPRCCCGNCYED